MPKFGSEPRFEPEPLELNSKFSSWFRVFAELNLLRSSSRFSPSENPLCSRLHGVGIIFSNPSLSLVLCHFLQA